MSTLLDATLSEQASLLTVSSVAWCHDSLPRALWRHWGRLRESLTVFALWGPQQAGPIATLEQETRGGSNPCGPCRTVATDGELLGMGGGGRRRKNSRALRWLPEVETGSAPCGEIKRVNSTHPDQTVPGASLMMAPQWLAPAWGPLRSIWRSMWVS